MSDADGVSPGRMPAGLRGDGVFLSVLESYLQIPGFRQMSDRINAFRSMAHQG